MQTTKSSAKLTWWLAALMAIFPASDPRARDQPPVTAATDAAALDIPNPRTPAPGVLSGGQASAEALAAAAAAGYRTVVNLRSQAEMAELAQREGFDEAAVVAELGMEYVFIPMAGAAGLTVDNAHRLAEVLAAPDKRPLLLHCASGNRVGALLALKAFHVDGHDADAALELGLESGLTRLEPAVREHLASALTIHVPAGWEGAYDFGYAPAVRVGDTVVLSGIPAAGEGSYEDKIRRMYQRTRELLEAAGASIGDVVELTTYHLEPGDADAFGAEFERYMPIHREFFGDHRPAWTAVGTTALLSATAVVEMRVLAVAGSGDSSRVVRRRSDDAGRDR